MSREREDVTARQILTGRRHQANLGVPTRDFLGVQRSGHVSLYCPLLPRLCPCSLRARRKGGGFRHGKGILTRVQKLRYTKELHESTSGVTRSPGREPAGNVCRVGGAELRRVSPLGFSLQSAATGHGNLSIPSSSLSPGGAARGGKATSPEAFGSAGRVGPRGRTPQPSEKSRPTTRGPALHEMKPRFNSRCGVIAAFIQMTSGAEGQEGGCRWTGTAQKSRSPEGERRSLYRRKWTDGVFNVQGSFLPLTQGALTLV